MIILVCGGRDYSDIKRVVEVLDAFNHFVIERILEGGANGADMLARQWAMRRDVPLTTYIAEWRKYHKQAGARRNQQMLNQGKPQLIVAFPGGKGTADMVRRAQAALVPVIEIDKKEEKKDDQIFLSV